MITQLHPVDSYDPKLNFWEEFPSFKVHRLFGEIWKENKSVRKLEASSRFMWALSLCYDKKSSMYTQPELDKWEVVSENLFNDPKFFSDISEDNTARKGKLVLPKMYTLRNIVDQFEKSIDTKLGMSLRLLESKLQERTEFMMSSAYTFDKYHESESGKRTLIKGTADQLDKMFTGTDKIVTLITKAMDDLNAIEGQGHMKGGEQESLSDGDDAF